MMLICPGNAVLLSAVTMIHVLCQRLNFSDLNFSDLYVPGQSAAAAIAPKATAPTANAFPVIGPTTAARTIASKGLLKTQAKGRTGYAGGNTSPPSSACLSIPTLWHSSTNTCTTSSSGICSQCCCTNQQADKHTLLVASGGTSALTHALLALLVFAASVAVRFDKQTCGPFLCLFVLYCFQLHIWCCTVASSSCHFVPKKAVLLSAVF